MRPTPTTASGTLRTCRTAWRRILLGLLAAGLAFWLPPSPTADRDAFAQCDVIPGTTKEFRGALGSLNRPYAIPNDDGEEIRIRLDPEGCETGTPGFVEDDYTVTLVFEPPGGGPRNAVVITTGSNCAERLPDPGSLPGGGSAHCVAPSDSDLIIRDACVGGPQAGARCSEDAECTDGACEPVDLVFRFPDTDGLFADPTVPTTENDDQTFTGPVTIAVTPITAPFPFGLASSRCADTPGLVACVDELYAQDSTCETGPSHLDPVFGHFTALPPANNYQALCTTDEPGSPCEPVPPDERNFRFTIDVQGNVLIPMEYRGVLFESDKIPTARVILGNIEAVAFEVTAPIDALVAPGDPVQVPSEAFIGSFSTGGQRLPPIFTPISGPVNALSLFGLVDAPIGVIRIQQRGCVGGAQEGLACTSDTSCGMGGLCRTLFDFSDRLTQQAGPVLVADADFDLFTEGLVPLDGLIESESMFAFVANEAIEKIDDCDGDGEPDCTRLNDDSDGTDPVLLIRSRKTAAILPIGTNEAEGRAVTRVRDGRFRFPAVVVEDDIVAFLEPEPLEGHRDANSDDDVFDTLLRVFRLRSKCNDAPFCAESLLPGIPIAADAAPFIDAKSLGISDGLVFFRASEAANARYVTTRIATGSSFSPKIRQALSADGRVLAFTDHDVLRVRPLETGDPDNFTVDSSLSSEPLSISDDGSVVGFSRGLRDLTTGHQLNVGLSGAAISGDGRFAVFVNNQSGLGPVSVLERDSGVSTPIQSTEPAAQLSSFSLSRDASMISFHRFRLPDNAFYVHDRVTETTTRIVSGFRHESAPLTLSSRGRLALFHSSGFFVRDLSSGTDIRVDVSSSGSVAAKQTSRGKMAAVSPDERFITFGSTSDDLVPGAGRICQEETICINPPCPLVDVPCSEAFLHDLTTGLTRSLTKKIPSEFDVGGNFDAGSLSRGARIVTSLRIPDGRRQRFGSEVWLHHPDPADTSADFSGDGDLEDVVLQVFDTRSRDSEPLIVAPATDVVVAAGYAAFAVPETELGEDRNGDGDTEDRVVHLYRNRADVVNLGIAVDGLAISADWIAALESESQSGSDLNGDGDTNDLVLTLNELASATRDSWLPARVAADSVAVVGSVFAFATPERSQGETDLNADRDTLDRVLHLGTATPDLPPVFLNLGFAVEDFVLGERLLAFRVRETAQDRHLNGDDDKEDDVLFVYDLVRERIYNTGQGVIPCPLEACDPRFPYQVSGDTVTFITAECGQGDSVLEGCPEGGTDLNGDGDARDIVKQVFNALEASLVAPADGEAADCVDAVASASAGICTTTGAACADDPECASGTCYLPPGRCIADIGPDCDPRAAPETPGACPEPQFCSLDDPSASIGTCQQDQGPCATDSDCTDPLSTCQDSAADIQRLFSPIASMGRAGDQAVFSSGRCVRECETGESCGPSGFQRRGSCRMADDCQAGFTCRADLIIAGSADSDGDGIGDPFDNCEHDPNTDQADADADGVGDRCDRSGPDADSDSWPDLMDNCTLVANDQTDSNRDGFGNACDCDLDDDGLVDFLDLGRLKRAFFTGPSDAGWNPDADLNVDGFVDFLDLGRCKSGFFQPPGPAGSL